MRSNDIYGLYCECNDCKTDKEVRYVGQTVRGSAERFKFHKYDAIAENYSVKSDLPVYRWMRKHGIDNIRYKVLETGIASEDLNNREIWWVKQMRTYSVENLRGLNLSEGGESLKGYRHTSQAIEKMRAREYSEETRKKMSESAKKRGVEHLKPYLGQFSGEKHPNATLTDEIVRQIKSYLWDGYGVREVAEIFGVGKAAVTHLKAGRTWGHIPWPTDRARTPSTAHKRYAETRRGVELSKETREKISNTLKTVFNTPEVKKIRSEITRGERNPSAKLNEGDVKKIRLDAEAGETYESLGRRYGVSGRSIAKIVKRKTWKHVK